MSSNRLEEGGRIDRREALTFYFNGTQYQGYAGDTLASALIANGVCGRRPQLQAAPAPRYRRQRGPKNPTPYCR